MLSGRLAPRGDHVIVVDSFEFCSRQEVMESSLGPRLIGKKLLCGLYLRSREEQCGFDV